MKAALVTGAGMRIGRALALALAADGFFVFVHYNSSADEAHATVADIEAAGGKGQAVQADLASAEEAAALVGKCQAPDVQLSCLVNSASLFKLDRAPDATAADFDLHMAINLRAPMLLAQALFGRPQALLLDEPTNHLDLDSIHWVREFLVRYDGTLIVNMLDQKLANLNPDFLTYTLSKIGLQGLTTLLAQSFAPRARVAGIAPGLTLRSGSQTDARFEAQHTENPLGVGVTTDDLVRALRFIVRHPPSLATR